MKRRKKTKTVTRRRRSRVSGLNSKDLGGMVTNQLLPVVGGLLVGKYLPTILGKVSPSAVQYSNYAAIGLGAVLGVTQKGMLATAGLGLAAGGALNVVGDLLDGQPSANGLGLLPAGQPAVYLAGPGDAGTETVLAPNTILKVQ